MSDDSVTIEQLGAAILKNQKLLETTVEFLEGSSRRQRQSASSALALAAKTDATVIAPYSDQLVDALNRPEAQTRWECLDALTEIVSVDSRSCDKALPGAEAALFDEENGLVRLAAMRFLCKLGSTTENRSEKCWPLIDEGIQCYHGDLEFTDMMVAVMGFAKGKISSDVKEKLKERMTFDAEHSRGSLKKRAQQIIEAL